MDSARSKAVHLHSSELADAISTVQSKFHTCISVSPAQVGLMDEAFNYLLFLSVVSVLLLFYYSLVFNGMQYLLFFSFSQECNMSFNATSFVDLSSL